MVRGNGSGQKPRDVAKAVHDRSGIRINGKEVLDILNKLERNGLLSYGQADKNNRHHRAGFRPVEQF